MSTCMTPHKYVHSVFAWAHAWPLTNMYTVYLHEHMHDPSQICTQCICISTCTTTSQICTQCICMSTCMTPHKYVHSVFTWEHMQDHLTIMYTHVQTQITHVQAQAWSMYTHTHTLLRCYLLYTNRYQPPHKHAHTRIQASPVHRHAHTLKKRAHKHTHYFSDATVHWWVPSTSLWVVLQRVLLAQVTSLCSLFNLHCMWACTYLRVCMRAWLFYILHMYVCVYVCGRGGGGGGWFVRA